MGYNEKRSKKEGETKWKNCGGKEIKINKKLKSRESRKMKKNYEERRWERMRAEKEFHENMKLKTNRRDSTGREKRENWE